MGDRGGRRVAFLGVLIASLLVTLIGRLYYVQVLDRNPPTQAVDGRVGTIVVPAVRGQIVDDRGRPLVTNTPTHIVTVDRQTLLAQPDKGVAVLHALARSARPVRADAGRIDHAVRGHRARSVLDR